jgi:hypothetical protein
MYNTLSIEFLNRSMQSCGSESGIRCLFDPCIRDPGWVKIKILFQDAHPGSYFRELRIFLVNT